MDDIKFTWFANINAGSTNITTDSLPIFGELVDASICVNKFALDEPELPKLVEQIPTVTLRADHGASIRDVIGGLVSGSFDSKNKKVMFGAEIDDPQIKLLAQKGRLKYVSIGATADAFCSVCGKTSKPVKTCKCKDSHDIIKNVKLKEVSIVTNPAFINSEFKPGFLAGIESALNQFNTVISDSSQEEGGEQNLNKKMEEKREMSTPAEKVEGTTLKPAGSDAIVVLGEKLEGIVTRLEKLERDWAKKDEEAKKVPPIPKKEDEEDEGKKKEEAILQKFEQVIAPLVTKLDELCKKPEAIPKDIPKAKKEEPEEDEEEEDEAKKVKKEPVKGAKVEDPETKVTVTADATPAWWNEIVAFAKKNILD